MQKQILGGHWQEEVKIDSTMLFYPLLRMFLFLNPRKKFLIGESEDQASIDRIASSTHVLLSTAGPYAKYGTPVVDACVRKGTDYCDLTGEMGWIRKIIDLYDGQAKSTNARIVPSCGFDSIPSDIGAYFLAKNIREKFGTPVKSIRNIVEVTGGISGGTISSGIGAIEEMQKGKQRPTRFFLNPSSPPPPSATTQPGDIIMPVWDEDVKKYVCIFPLAPSNVRYVRRTQAILNYPYGNFKYSEGMVASSFIVAWVITFLVCGFMLLMQLKIVRTLVGKIVKPGTGPSRSTMKNGYFTCVMVGHSLGGEKEGGRVFAKYHLDLDPGYMGTALMISQSSFALLRTRKLAREGGVLTPATAMGDSLIESLKDAGMTFSISETYPGF
eukprot:TRINITY_DN3249_c0_g1_i1.p1 TRINITY_DN3249_c0_g1~~TRINITY_DN3249_c0_g1_i1.p1  ORF type:complete len:384 (-),score=112.24 TRINITY_DN3249_c0_g1_i1:10-1161(-)